MIRFRSIADFLALRRNTTLLLGALVFAGTGERLWLGFVPKYIQTLGGSIFVIGAFDALQTLLGALYSYPGGYLTDRWGQRRALMAFSSLSIAGYVFVFVWPHWLALLLGAFLFLAWSAMSLPTTFTVVHHPPFNVGKEHWFEQHMRVLAPLFEQHGVAFVLSGHEHNCQQTTASSRKVTCHSL